MTDEEFYVYAIEEVEKDIEKLKNGMYDLSHMIELGLWEEEDIREMCLEAYKSKYKFFKEKLDIIRGRNGSLV